MAETFTAELTSTTGSFIAATDLESNQNESLKEIEGEITNEPEPSTPSDSPTSSFRCVDNITQGQGVIPDANFPSPKVSYTPHSELVPPSSYISDDSPPEDIVKDSSKHIHDSEPKNETYHTNSSQLVVSITAPPSYFNGKPISDAKQLGIPCLPSEKDMHMLVLRCALYPYPTTPTISISSVLNEEGITNGDYNYMYDTAQVTDSIKSVCSLV